jgi:hypothetical protein
LSWPDAEPLELSDVAFDARTVAPAVEIFRGLRLDRDQPHDTTLSPAAFAQFKTWHAHNRRVQIESRRGLERQWAAKAPFHLERLALVLHLLAWPHEEQRTLSTETMRDAIELLEYFRDHLVRVLPAFGTRVTGGIKSRILRILRTSKTRTDEGWVTRSDLSNGLRTVTPDELTGALNELLLAKIVERDVKTTATKPGERWRLAPEPGRNRAGKDSENSDDFRRESVAAHESTRTEQENPKNLKNLNGVPAETRTTARPAAASSPSAGR